METVKHTPGPWAASGDTVKGPAGNIVAECCGYSVKATDPSHRAQGGREANAHLIAAAPELLAALEALESEIRYLNETALEHPSMPPRRIMLAARAAIAKARGEAQQ